MSRERLSLLQSRRIALSAQGFSASRPSAPARRHLSPLFDRLHLLQIDSINVLARAHYMPLYSRLGAYDPALLDEAAYGAPSRRQVFEYWGHEASFLRLDLHPLMRWRMAHAADNRGIYGGLATFGRERREFIAAVKREVATRGKIGAGELERSLGGREEARRAGSWWSWSEVKHALEWLFWAGEIAIAERRGFERIYDLTERVIPARILSMPTLAEADAKRELIRLAARAHGIASEKCLRDYFRLAPADARLAIAELIEEGALRPVEVEGWGVSAYMDAKAVRPRQVRARALLSPFDPLVWERARTERLHDFRYRIEIYTPAHKREYGYYTLPFLLGERIVARLDLKAERAQNRLLAASIHAEPGVDIMDIGQSLAEELTLLARWLNLSDIAIPKDWRNTIPL